MFDCIRFSLCSISVCRISSRFFLFRLPKKKPKIDPAASTLATETKSENLRITDYPICPTFISFYEGRLRILAIYYLLFTSIWRLNPLDKFVIGRNLWVRFYISEWLCQEWDSEISSFFPTQSFWFTSEWVLEHFCLDLPF